MSKDGWEVRDTIRVGNNPIPVAKQEKIVELAAENTAINRIKTLTKTSRPTVRKYIEIHAEKIKEKREELSIS